MSGNVVQSVLTAVGLALIGVIVAAVIGQLHENSDSPEVKSITKNGIDAVATVTQPGNIDLLPFISRPWRSAIERMGHI